jgi:hypothetical protein
VGTGKTFLTYTCKTYPTLIVRSSVIKHLKKSADPSTAVAAYFCDGKTSDKQDPRNIFGSLVKQLVQRLLDTGDPNVVAQGLESVVQIHKRHKQDSHRHSKDPSRVREIFREFISALLGFSATFTRIYIIIDALDECERRQNLVAELKRIFNSNNVNILLVSRASSAENDIKEAFQGQSAIRMEKEKTKADIEKYIDWALEYMFPTTIPGHVTALIKERLIGKNDGMYVTSDFSLTF